MTINGSLIIGKVQDWQWRQRSHLSIMIIWIKLNQFIIFVKILMENQQSASGFTLVLPTKTVPVALSHLTRPLTERFLVRYRNILVQNESGITWGLVKDNNYCGKAFVIEITEAQAHNIQLIKQPGEMIEIVAQNYILLKIPKQVQKPSQPLTEQQVKGLFQEIGGTSKVDSSFLKNAFDTYEQYLEMTEKVAALVSPKEKEKEISIAQKVQLQFNAKKLSGKSLLEVPKIIKQTGNWSQEQTIALKIADN